MPLGDSGSRLIRRLTDQDVDRAPVLPVDPRVSGGAAAGVGVPPDAGRTQRQRAASPPLIYPNPTPSPQPKPTRRGRVQPAPEPPDDTDGPQWPKASLHDAVHAAWLATLPPPKSRWERLCEAAERHIPQTRLRSTILALALCVAAVAAYAWLYLGSVYWLPDGLDGVPVLIYSGDVGFTSTSPALAASLKQLLQSCGCSSSTSSVLGACLSAQLLAAYPTLFQWQNLNADAQISGLQRSNVATLVQDTSRAGGIYFGTALSNNFSTFFTGTQSPTAFAVELFYKGGFAPATTAEVVAEAAAATSALAANFSQCLYRASSNATLAAIASKMSGLALVQSLSQNYTDLAPAAQFGQAYATLVAPAVLWMVSFAVATALLAYYRTNRYCALLPELCLARPLESLSPGLKVIARAEAERRAVATEYDSDRVDDSLPSLQLVLSCFALWSLATLLAACTATAACLALPGASWTQPVGTVLGFLWFFALSATAVHVGLYALVSTPRAGLASALLLVVQIASSQALAAHSESSPFFLVGVGLPIPAAVLQLQNLFFGVQPSSQTLNYLVVLAWLGGSALIVVVAGFVSKSLLFMPPLSRLEVPVDPKCADAPGLPPLPAARSWAVAVGDALDSLSVGLSRVFPFPYF